MAILTKITSKGQVKIPEEIRLQLAIMTGDRAYFETIDFEKKQVAIKFFPSLGVVEQLAGSLNPNGKIQYVPIGVARKKAGLLLDKKYGLKK